MRKLLVLTLTLVIILTSALPAMAASNQPQLIEFWVGKNDYVIDGLTKKGCLYTVPFLENGRVCMEILELRFILGFAEEKQNISLNEDVVILPNGAVCASIMGAVGTAYSVEYSGQEKKVTLRLTTTATQSPVANAPATPPATSAVTNTPQPVKTEEHKPTDTEWTGNTGNTPAVVTVWDSTPGKDSEEYKYLVDGEFSFPKGSGGKIYYFASLDDARRSYDFNQLKAGKDQPAASSPAAPTATPAPAPTASGTIIKPSATPTKQAPNQVVFEPNGEVVTIQSEYWVVVEVWNPDADDTAAYKYLIEANQSRSFPENSGGSAWFCVSKAAAEKAFKENPKPAGK